MAGWVKLHRKIRECDLWLEKPFSRGQAWMDMILEANHKDKNVLLGAKTILVTRGSYITSIRKMSERWGWSNTKVVAFLAYLKTDGMISYKSDTKKTLVTIENYGVYQDSSEEETTQKHHQNDAETTQKHTTKKEKKEKKEKNNINTCSEFPSEPAEQKKETAKAVKVFDESSLEFHLASKLRTAILNTLPNATCVPKSDSVHDMQKWARVFDLILRLDKISPQEMERLIEFATTDQFWHRNILSPAKLREKIDRLRLEIKDKNRPKAKQQGKIITQGTSDKFKDFSL